MKWTETYIPTLREKQTDAELISHQLLLRGGYIRKLASGIYLYLPLMQRVIEKFSNIVREEMNKIGALEITMSVLCPAELWQKSGRYDTVGKLQMRLKDRHDHEMVLCGTHEETVTDLVAGELKSYKQLPLNLYQIQSKFRDEIRPRFGLLRGREFIMKDAYTFDADEESFMQTYEKIVGAYFAIFKRAGFDAAKVESDTGDMGGKAAHEFMLLVDTEAGEEMIITCEACGYAANVEKAEFRDLTRLPQIDKKAQMETVDTPGAATIDEVTSFLEVESSQLVKTLIYMVDGNPVAALVRGDRELNEIKLARALEASRLEMAGPEVVERLTGAPVGYAGPIGLKDIRLIADPLVVNRGPFIAGANEAEKHIRNVLAGRDFECDQIVDISSAKAGDGCPRCDGIMAEKEGIEVGNTFMLGTKYSETIGANYLDADGREQPCIMGSYGIGITRTPQAVLERFHDERGIIWPKNLAPYLVELVPLNMTKESHQKAACEIYEALTEAGIEVLLDDRVERAGVKFNDADLIGMPIRIAIGDKSLASGKIELKARALDEVRLVSIENIVMEVKDLADRIS